MKLYTVGGVSGFDEVKKKLLKLWLKSLIKKKQLFPKVILKMLPNYQIDISGMTMLK